LVLPACSDDGGQTKDMGQGDTAQPDAQVDPCKAVKEDGAQCGGGGACKDNETCVIDGPDGSAVCRAKCEPSGSNQCGGPTCKRECVKIVDSGGKELPYGACANGWVQAGDPCGQGGRCDLSKDLKCIGTGGVSFCRNTCKDSKDCKGYKITCVDVANETWNACGFGSDTKGPGEGGDCSKADTYCKGGFFCDPSTKKCLKACSNLASVTDPCGKGSTKVCKKVTDTSANVTLGWGCLPGPPKPDGGVGDASSGDASKKDASPADATKKDAGTAG
jgi:hypothetical protein